MWDMAADSGRAAATATTTDLVGLTEVAPPVRGTNPGREAQVRQYVHELGARWGDGGCPQCGPPPRDS